MEDPTQVAGKGDSLGAPRSTGQASGRLGSYEILEPIGAGAMGEVYRARDRKLGREVAIKVLPERFASDPDRLARFEREAQLLAALNHPAIATLYGFEEAESSRFLVLELVDGDTLERLLAGGALPLDRALDIARQIAGGLEAAHAAGIVHRDLKPANVKVTPQGRVKVLDFGIARWSWGVPPEDTPTLPDGMTRAGAILGTPAYMSPEQSRAEPLDQRSDIWAFGCVLYEMLSGQRAFGGPSVSDILAAILTREPNWEAVPLRVPQSIRELLQRCLKKDRDQRLPAIADARDAIEKLSGAARTLWALEDAMPEVHRHIDQDDHLSAHELIREVEQVLGADHREVRKAWEESSGKLEITSDPAGARVGFQRYEDFDGPWLPLGATPIRDDRFPRGVFRFRIEKPGYATVEVPFNVALSSYVRKLTESPLRSAEDPSTRLDFRLVPEDQLPAGTVAVEGGIYSPIPLVGLIYGNAAKIPRFFIDRTEVTNRAFQEFVAAGGYERRELWPERFEIDGREVPWDEARRSFVDTTGRFAPAGWELGEYPEGTADHPVAGVSWFEAMAYCSFRGRRLPTVFHWARAAFPSWDNGAPLSPVMARFSNFSQQGASPVGAHRATSIAGALDMGGNVAEWTLNAGGGGRYELGGSWADPAYRVNHAASVPPETRRATTGFRCALYEDAPEIELLARPLEFPAIDFANVPPMSDDAFEQTRRLHGHRRAPLDAEVESSETLSWGAREEWVRIDAAYPGERIPIRLRLPTGGSPPYQSVIVVHSMESLFSHTLRGHLYEAWEEFVVKTGRALVEPVLAGTFERHDGRVARDFGSLKGRDQYLLRWVQDLGRAIDYVDERPDLDGDRIAFLGTSFGAYVAPHLLPYEPRYRAAVLWAGGFAPYEPPGHVHLRVNLCRRTTIPVLLLNGRYDYQMPIEYQKAMIDAFGAPEEQKRHVLFEASHWPYPRGELIKETLGWLDRWLGPVR